MLVDSTPHAVTYMTSELFHTLVVIVDNQRCMCKVKKKDDKMKS